VDDDDDDGDDDEDDTTAFNNCVKYLRFQVIRKS
jgi:hypothetical protein